MPTLNKTYNRLLKCWAIETGKPQLPACENCNKDLTGQAVFERSCWVCEACDNDPEFGRYDGPSVNYREDFHADS